jgi:hypothetical protein
MGRYSQRWHARGILCCVALLSAFAAQPQAKPQPFLSPETTVVLLAGLPGDLESERKYREELQGWIDLVDGIASSGRLIVLTDDLESLRFTDRPQTQKLKADRASFLGVGASLKGSTNPVVVVAWGHGGRQGAVPVFHVRGPRLTPADFKALAGQIGADSTWILLFPGSGSFARELTDERRQIISSERDTVFNSDPIGMVLLLKILRAKPDSPVAQISQQFGRATAAWYTERNLARTEEPTLWAGKEKPVLLAESDSLGSAAPKQTEPAETAPPRPDKPMPGNLPPSWNGITRADPKQFPQADAVTLVHRTSYTLGNNPAISSEREDFIQILTIEGKRVGDFDFSYSPPFEELEFLDCEVLRPDGTLLRLDPEAIRETREQSVGDYQFDRRKFFSLPGVVPGAVLHVRQRAEWKKFPLPHISLAIPVGSILPTLQTTVEVSVPKSTPFHFAWEQIPAPDPQVKQTSYGAQYSWRFQNLPSPRHDVLEPHAQEPRLVLSTFPDWAAFADWYGRLTQLTDEITPEIAAKAVELTREATNEREKILALYNFVTSLRYVAVPLGVNSFRPHAAANVLRNQFGDCKDKANLFNTLLRSLKIDACLVLVPRFSQAHDEVPGFAFNHAISCVSIAGKPMWIDTTDDVCRFGMLPPGDPGRKVLLIDGKTAALTPLPSPSLQEHQLKLHAELTWPEPKAPFPTSVSAIASGYVDYALRTAGRDIKELGQSVPLLHARFRPSCGAFSLEKQTATAISALDENFTWQADGGWHGLAARKENQWTLLAPFWLPKEWDQALHRRTSPLFLNQGYPLSLEQEIEFSLPPGGEPVGLPGVEENKADPLRWRVQWTRMADGKLKTSFRAELLRGELDSAESPLFQKQFSQLLEALAASARISVPK